MKLIKINSGTQKSYSIRPLLDPASSTWTYLLCDNETKQAAIIDTVADQVERDVKLIHETGLTLKYAIETHVHADHITGAGALQDKLGAKIVFGVGAKDVEGADIFLDDGEELSLGNTTIKTITTPGHTNSCTSYYVDGAVFTGDALLIRGCGRTDFQEGSAAQLFETVRNKLFSLPEQTRIYPAHDYKGMLYSTIAEEKQFNPRLNLSNTKEDFVQIMDNLNLPNPKMIDVAVPANLKAGKC